MRASKYSVNLDNNETQSKNGVIPSAQEKITNLSGPLKLIDVNFIDRNEYQARSYMDEEEFQDLKDSIRREGLHEPIVVRYNGETGRYTVYAGHRRLRACMELGTVKIVCLILQDLQESTFAAISTNQFRVAIHPIDKGIEVQSLIDGFLKEELTPPTIDQIAQYYRVSPSTIKEWKQYLHIDESVRSLIVKNDIRTKSFLRKASKICKAVNSTEELDERERKQIINEEIRDLIDSHKRRKSKRAKSDDSLRDGSSFRYFIGYKKSSDEFYIAESIESLSKKDKKKLKDKLIEALELL